MRVSVLEDGSALAMAAPASGPARFEAHLFDAAGKGTQVASLTWPDSTTSDHDHLETCHAGAAHWALVRGRHLLVSETGATWREVQDLGTELDVDELACTADRIAFATASEQAQLRSCDRTRCSDPVAFKRHLSAVVALRFDGPNLAVWLGTQLSEVHLQSGAETMLAVHRIEGGKLVLDRVHIVASSGRVPVVRDARGFFALRTLLE